MPKVKGKGKTWDDAVIHYMRVIAPTKKPSTRWGYEQVLKGENTERWVGVPLLQITRAKIDEWAADLASKQIKASTQRNHHIVLRTGLKAAVGVLIDEAPSSPPLPRVGQTAVQTPDAEDVEALINEVDEPDVCELHRKQRQAARLAFALAAYAGLRAGEVRALRRRDVDLKRRVITVRLSRTRGEEAPPKSVINGRSPSRPSSTKFWRGGSRSWGKTQMATWPRA